MGETNMVKKDLEKVDQASELNLSRRNVLGAGALVAGAGIIGSQMIDPIAGIAHAAGSDAPIKIGFQAHRTGIGALYGRWYERLQMPPLSTLTVSVESPDVRLKLLQKTTVLTLNAGQM